MTDDQTTDWISIDNPPPIGTEVEILFDDAGIRAGTREDDAWEWWLEPDFDFEKLGTLRPKYFRLQRGAS